MVFILKDYVKPIMQLLTNDITEFNMRLLTTKCLNTSVMLMYFMLGKEGIRIANYCDTHQTIKRHNENIDNNLEILNSLKTDILSTKNKRRYIYYILLTDGYFAKGTDNVYFPGHVVVFEKIPSTDKPYYYMYQSYINEYDLAGHYSKTSVRMSHSQVVSYMNKLSHILQANTWNDTSVKNWKDLTFVDTSHMKDTSSKNRFYICYKRATAKICLENIKKYTKTKLNELKSQHTNMNMIYGDVSKYDSSQNPMTNLEMKSSLESLLNKLKYHKKNM
jgi:hypothetical protein